MKQLAPTTTIAIDDKNTFQVNQMSTETQQLVEFYDDWRQQEQELISDLNKVRAALRDLQQQLTAQVQKDLTAATEAAEQAQPDAVQDVPVKPARTRTRK